MEGQGFARRRTYLLATTRRQGPCCACPISASYCQKDQEQGENRQRGLHLSRSSPVGTEKSGAAARSVHQHPQGSQDSNGHSYLPACSTWPPQAAQLAPTAQGPPWDKRKRGTGSTHGTQLCRADITQPQPAFLELAASSPLPTLQSQHYLGKCCFSAQGTLWLIL